LEDEMEDERFPRPLEYRRGREYTCKRQSSAIFAHKHRFHTNLSSCVGTNPRIPIEQYEAVLAKVRASLHASEINNSAASAQVSSTVEGDMTIEEFPDEEFPDGNSFSVKATPELIKKESHKVKSHINNLYHYSISLKGVLRRFRLYLRVDM